MKDAEEYEFWIDAYSPDDIPLQRLGEYMAQLGRLLGSQDRVHPGPLRGGSTILPVRVEREAVPKVFNRIEAVKRAEAPGDAIQASTALNVMLRDDNAIGVFRRVRLQPPANDEDVLLRFPGREIPKPQKVGPFSEQATFKGELVRLEGEDDTKHAGVKDSQGRTWVGHMDRNLAVKMREHLFDWVMVTGDARWIRTEDGEWILKSFHITGFKPLQKDTLDEDIKNLRSVPGSQWKEMDDPVGFIREQRKDDDEIH
jgi:hypothetical protein